MYTSTGWIVSSLLLSAFLSLSFPSRQADALAFSLSCSLSDTGTNIDTDTDTDAAFVDHYHYSTVPGCESSFLRTLTHLTWLCDFFIKAAEIQPYSKTRTFQRHSTLTTSKELPTRLLYELESEAAILHLIR
ncbi:hypothetical protein F4821DRAFT_200151 [Hypoxylon rubiginosum]|uniref:Uncharacterized protein n=1 Tax=Hypoxylon rubiginosum TaxID=110542 RepID=A0ACC0DFX0_9PEZI|nr:hypothetical protein F4821DRAFT_200151 [Hypoxylon rubiginosum]